MLKSTIKLLAVLVVIASISSTFVLPAVVSAGVTRTPAKPSTATSTSATTSTCDTACKAAALLNPKPAAKPACDLRCQAYNLLNPKPAVQITDCNGLAQGIACKGYDLLNPKPAAKPACDFQCQAYNILNPKGTTPRTPANPATPRTPAKPSQPSKPANPATPRTPAKPTIPSKPVNPATPVRPYIPAKPIIKPVNPTRPPYQPAQPCSNGTNRPCTRPVPLLPINPCINGRCPVQPKCSLPHDIDGHWSEIYIRRLCELKVMEGYTDGTFRPNQQITRAELTKMADVAAKIQQDFGCYDDDCGMPFIDTRRTWYIGWVRSAWMRGIVQGVTYNQFRPNDSTTREQATKIILAAFKYQPLSVSYSFFNDVKGWSVGWIELAHQFGIVQGIGNGNFDPYRPVTRGEAAKIIAKTIEFYDTHIR